MVTTARNLARFGGTFVSSPITDLADWLSEWQTLEVSEWRVFLDEQLSETFGWLYCDDFLFSSISPQSSGPPSTLQTNTNNCLLLVVHDLEENNTEPPKLRHVHRIAQTYKPVNGALRKTDQCTTTTTTSIHSSYLPHSAKTTTPNHCCGSRPLSGRGSKL